MAVTVGLVGSGMRATTVHAPALAATPGIEFVGVWGRSPRAVEKLARQYDVSAFGTFRDLLGSCEALSFAVPPAVQSDLGSIAARAHKHLLLEVPIAWDTAGAEDLAAAVAAARVISQVAFTWRYTEPVRQLLGEVGSAPPPRGARGRATRAARPPTSRWRDERRALFDHGPHVADFLDAALGEIVDVEARHRENDSVRLKFEHRLSGDSETLLSTSTAIERDQARFEFEFEETDRTRVVDLSDAAGTADYSSMFGEFAEAVRTGRVPGLDVNRGLHVQRVVEAADTELLLHQ
ncbi:Gfo/Idh/MocA family oxidoreductase [Nocardioides aquiterrae]|uniref:Gfo/Idh/MocA family oxidoreductase n=1 Tax=Nocardioides aquiterrae TaxID=203799 RepID=A0ABN1UFV8_9ACTN